MECQRCDGIGIVWQTTSSNKEELVDCSRCRGTRYTNCSDCEDGWIRTPEDMGEVVNYPSSPQGARTNKSDSSNEAKHDNDSKGLATEVTIGIIGGVLLFAVDLFAEVAANRSMKKRWRK